MADVITSKLGLRLPDFDSSADQRVNNGNFSILDDAVTNANLPSAVGGLVAAGVPVSNLLTNPGLELWQRGVGPYVAHQAFSADRWQLFVEGGASLSVSRIASTIGSGGYSAQAVYTHVPGGDAGLYQLVEGAAQLRNLTLTFAVQVKASAGARVRAWVYDDFNLYRYSAYNVGAGSERLVITAPVWSAANAVSVGVRVDGGSAAVEINDAVLVVGSVVPPYAPLHPSDEWERALRYYQEIGGLDPAGEFVGTAFVVSTTSAQVILRYVQEMAGVPTVAVVSPTGFAVGNAAGATVAVTALALSVPPLTTRRECRLIATVAGGLVAGNATYLIGLTATPRITLESNPVG